MDIYQKRLAQKLRRSQHWRERQARVQLFELREEYNRRTRYWWTTMHRDPSKRVDGPVFPPRRDDGWWGRALHMADPMCQASPRNRNLFCQPHAPRFYPSRLMLPSTLRAW